MDRDTATATPRATTDLERLYRDNVRRVFGLARNRVGPRFAIDVTAEVFLAAARAIREQPDREIATAWLLRVTRNKAADHWRRQYRAEARAHLVVVPTGVVDGPEVTTEAAAYGAVVRSALDQLPHLDQALLMLHHVDGIPVAELAASMGKTVAATESALARARQRFRHHYGRSRRG